MPISTEGLIRSAYYVEILIMIFELKLFFLVEVLKKDFSQRFFQVSATYEKKSLIHSVSATLAEFTPEGFAGIPNEKRLGFLPTLGTILKH